MKSLLRGRIADVKMILGMMVAGCAVLASCASTPMDVEQRAFESSDYAKAFDAAKDVVREYSFELDRVDAASGVISTAPRAWSGAATPWVPFGSTPGDALGGFVQFEQRTARVEFLPAEEGVERPADMRSYEGPIRAEVSVTVERLYRPGRRVDATSVRLSGFTADPTIDPKGGPPAAFAAEHRQDGALAARVHKAIISRLGQ